MALTPMILKSLSVIGDKKSLPIMQTLPFRNSYQRKLNFNINQRKFRYYIIDKNTIRSAIKNFTGLMSIFPMVSRIKVYAKALHCQDRSFSMYTTEQSK